MNDILNNRMSMIGSSIRVAEIPEHSDVWENVPPLEFGTEFA